MANITTTKTDRRLVMAKMNVTDFDEFNRLLALAGIPEDTKEFTPDQETVLQQVKNEPPRPVVGESRPPVMKSGDIEATIEERLAADEEYLQGLVDYYRSERRQQMSDFVGKIVDVDRLILKEFSGEGFMQQYHAIESIESRLLESETA